MVAEKEKQEGIHGQWQQESLAQEFLEQVKNSADTECTSQNDEMWILCFERTEMARNTKAKLK